MVTCRYLAAVLLLLWMPLQAFAQGVPDYVRKAGERVSVFENSADNYSLDLSAEAYTFVDFTGQIPEASFAAIRFAPNVFSLVIAESLGRGPSAEQYAEMVRVAMVERLESREDAEYKGYQDIGMFDERGMQVFKRAVYAEIASMPVTYIISTTIDGDRAYQLLTFATNAEEAVVQAEADKLLAGFTVIDHAANLDIPAPDRDFRDYPSKTFAYRFRARAKSWFAWNDVKESNDAADIGALSSQGYGSVVMPVCWKGAAPTQNAILRVAMQQFGEDYPSDFISGEREISKGDAAGKLLTGVEDSDGTEYLYHQWIVANQQCAYTLAAWGPSGSRGVEKALNNLWTDFEILDDPGALRDEYEEPLEKVVNAYLLNGLGLHYYEARGYRDAFRFFSQANDADPDDEAYLTNSLRALVELDAYHEAYDWLQPRLAPFSDNQIVQSWDAWLAYQTDDAAKAIRIYRELFANGYREDDDFTVFLSMLADAGEWDEIDATYAEYTKGGVNDKTRLLRVNNLSRRGEHEAALALLDEMTEGRPFNADMAYERMAILDAAGNPAEMLRVAELLIENGYRSLQSYYYKGDAEYQLRLYRAARESFEEAQSFAPGNANIREYLEAIDLMLGQGDVSTISTPIKAVALPRAMQKVFDADDVSGAGKGYAAEYLARISGFEHAGGERRRQSWYQKIRILDDNGVAQFSTLQFDYDPSYENLFVNTLVVRDADGEVLGEGDLNTYYITNSETGYEASTEKTVHLPVPSLAAGVTIEVVVSKSTSVEDGTFPLETIYMASDRPIDYSAVFVAGEVDGIRYKTNGVTAPVKRGNSLVWELQQPQSYRWEPLQPYFDQILPWVQIGTVGEDWADVGNEYLGKITDKLDFDKVADRAERLVEGVDSEMRRIDILAAWVQDEIHYEAIEFGRRAYIPKTARETIRDRYGDCKDHAVLLYAMLNAVGIESSLALVNLQQSVLPELPNTDQFNHMIVAVEAADGPMFIDTTDKDLRLGKLPPRSMAGNHALLLKDTPELVAIPDYETGLTGIVVERVVEPGDDGYIRVTETARLTGYQAAELRGQLRTIETSEMQASLQRWLATRYTDAELTDHFVENVFDAGYDLIVELQYQLPVDADGSFDTPGFLETYYLEYDRVADRRFPFEFYYPMRMSASTSIRIPSGRGIDAVTGKPDVGESQFGTWQRSITKDGDSWQIQFDYTASDKRFEPGDYREFFEFQRDAIDAIEQPLTLR